MDEMNSGFLFSSESASLRNVASQLFSGFCDTCFVRSLISFNHLRYFEENAIGFGRLGITAVRSQ